ncbi:MAG: DUF4440 domain-containing protein [Acidobacteriota bacterium]
MKRLALCLAAGVLWAAPGVAAGEDPADDDPAAVRAQVVERIEAAAAAFNRGDSEEFAAQFWPEGTYEWIVPHSDHLEDRATIEETFHEYFELAPEGSVDHGIDEVRIDGDIAIVSGTYVVAGMGNLSGRVCYVAVAEQRGAAGWRYRHVWAMTPCGPGPRDPGDAIAN